MTEKTSATRGLIALEGTHGPDLASAAESLLRKLIDNRKACGISRWDSSNTFFEMRFAKSSVPPASARTLLLLYASDLIFRLRWEIEPALKEDKIMIAAPYVETAIAFGVAAGLPKRWLTDLFSFAPKPGAVYRIEEKKKRWHNKCKPGDGFVEFCCATLSNAYPYADDAELREESLAYLDALEDHKACRQFKKKAIEEICSGKMKAREAGAD